MLAHQGKILKNEIKSRGLTQDEMAQKLGMSRTNFMRYFKEETLKENFIEKVAKILEIEKDVFYPSGGGNQANQNAGNVNQGVVNGGKKNTLVVGTYSECMSELMLAKDQIIELQKKNIDLQDELLKQYRSRV